MPGNKVVLVTGVAGYWGARVAARLLTLPDLHVIGLDAAPPKVQLKDLDFVQTDVRNPLLADLLRDEEVDAVCHLALVESERRTEAGFDLNVMGTMKVFGAAAVAGVRKIVFKSSTAVYGARPDNSAFIPEEQPLPSANGKGIIADLAEVESFCNGFRAQYPEVILTVLRFPSIVGPTADTPMTRLLRLPVPPFLMGFDPLMQLIHEDDVVEALVHAIVHDAPGVFNVASEGVLSLSQLLGLAGKLGIPIFHLAAYWGNPLFGSLGVPVGRLWPMGLDTLRYSWVGDVAKMRDVLNFAPRYTATEAIRESAGHARLKEFGAEKSSLSYDEDRLRDTIERRRRERKRAPATAPGEQDTSLIEGDEEEEVL